MTLPSEIPIFPLPETVFFPRTVLPLHVFEPRYRQMVAETLPGDRIIGIVLLKDGWQNDYFASPDTYSVGCAGRMEDVTPLPDGRYTLSLVGLARVEIVRFRRLEPYRLAEVRVLDDRLPDESGQNVQERKVRLLAAYTSLAAAISGHPSSAFTLDASLEYERIVNLACMHLGIRNDEKQRLLELHDLSERGRRITRMLEGELERLLKTRQLDGDDDGTVH